MEVEVLLSLRGSEGRNGEIFEVKLYEINVIIIYIQILRYEIKCRDLSARNIGNLGGIRLEFVINLLLSQEA